VTRSQPSSKYYRTLPYLRHPSRTLPKGFRVVDLFLFFYFTIGGLYAIWFVVRHCSRMTKREIAVLTGIVFFLWPVVWGGVITEWVKARWRRRSLEFR
jgi:hypothetical protein